MSPRKSVPTQAVCRVSSVVLPVYRSRANSIWAARRPAENVIVPQPSGLNSGIPRKHSRYYGSAKPRARVTASKTRERLSGAQNLRESAHPMCNPIRGVTQQQSLGMSSSTSGNVTSVPGEGDAIRRNKSDTDLVLILCPSPRCQLVSN